MKLDEGCLGLPAWVSSFLGAWTPSDASFSGLEGFSDTIPCPPVSPTQALEHRCGQFSYVFITSSPSFEWKHLFSSSLTVFSRDSQLILNLHQPCLKGIVLGCVSSGASMLSWSSCEACMAWKRRAAASSSKTFKRPELLESRRQAACIDVSGKLAVLPSFHPVF